MGILLGLGLLCLITEILHGGKDDEDKHVLSVVYALRKIDTPSVLFFFGILVSVAALQSSGVLSGLATWITQTITNKNLIGITFGLMSSLLDNVPLVAAVQGMFPLSEYPTDHPFWEYRNGWQRHDYWLSSRCCCYGYRKDQLFLVPEKNNVVGPYWFFSGAIVYILI